MPEVPAFRIQRAGEPPVHGVDGCRHGAHRRNRYFGGRCAGPTSRGGAHHRHGPPTVRSSDAGWGKTEYRQGDILDRDAVDALVADADVVVHLAFVIMGSRAESARVNLAGTRNVFEATVAADRPRRLVYTSSVAAYGYHSDNPVPITEDVAPRGSPEHYYSEQKAACEAALAEITSGRRWRSSSCGRASSRDRGACARRCHALEPPSRSGTQRVTRRSRSSSRRSPIRALRCNLSTTMTSPPRSLLATTTSARPVPTTSPATECCRCPMSVAAFGARPVPVPRLAMSAASEVVARLPFVPSALEWLHAGRTSVVMDTNKAKSQLGWTPKYTAAETLWGWRSRSRYSLVAGVGGALGVVRPAGLAAVVGPWPDRQGYPPNAGFHSAAATP